jgi:hypothetical protein
MLDSTLAVIGVVADSTSATANAYASRSGGLIAYRGDSTLFVDPASMSMLVLDPAGKNVRTMSVPRTQDAFSLTMASTGFDAGGRLVYRAMPAMTMRGAPGGVGGAMTAPSIPDSAAIVRVDLTTRKVDTLTWIKTPKVNMQVTQSEGGRITMQSQINPLPLADDWAVLADGSVAVVRARDYHVDWVGPDGAVTSSPKVPFDWQRLTDEDKVAFIDSVKAARERLLASAPPGSANAAGMAGMAGMGGGGVMTMTRIEMVGGASGEPRRRGDGSTPPPSGGAGGPVMSAPQITFVDPSELPDYKPPFLPGSVRADADGNLWVRTVPTRAIPGGPIYDVINRKGELVDRVQVPANRTIVGFGPGGVVYLTSRDAAVGTRLERARVR